MDRSITDPPGFAQVGDSQRSSTTVNAGQPARGQQREMPWLQEVAEPVFVDMALVRMCRDELDAVNLCIDLSRLSDEVLCERLGVDKGHWSRMRKGRAHFPTAKRLALMRLCGNWAPLQYELSRTPIVERLKEQFARQVQRARDDGFGAWMGAAA